MLSAVLSIPLTVGGGVRSIDDVWQLLECGADKVAMNTAASENPDLINQVAERFGRQCTVVAIDDQQGSVYTHAGNRNTNRKSLEWSKEVAERGAGEILLTSIDCDGKQAGFNTQLLAQVREAVSIPIIASGGAGCLQHFSDAIQAGADAVLAASLFHDQVLSIQEVKSFLRSQNIEVRS
ncbi:MAG: HisA/HisF-related TIM barrel protein [Fimbriimonadaceae bacterium]